MKKLVFFFPWAEVSGGPFYLARLANDLAKTKQYEVYYTDYPQGLCNSLIKHRGIKILRYRNEGKNFDIFPKEPIVLVMPVYWAHMVPNVHPDTKIVFFNWHNECIPCLKRDWLASDTFINKFLGLVKETSSVFFCDKTHWMAQNTDDIIFKEEYVPVIIPRRSKIARPQFIQRKARNIAVLGRLCLDKIYSVLDLLDNIVEIRDHVKTNIYIIGEGDYQHLLFGRQYPSHINLIRCGTMDIRDVIALLSEKVDILFAMGTSILDGASIHLPAVVIPNDVKEFQCNRYPYLYESTGYSLGWYPSQIDDLDIKTHTVSEIFDDIYRRNRKREIGEKCYQYYLKNHSQNIGQFLSAVDASTLTCQAYRKFVKDNTNWRLFKYKLSVKLKEYHGATKKRFSLFGFPLYTLSQTNEFHYNLYICCIPFLRINRNCAVISVHILPAVWIFKTIRNLFKILSRSLKRCEK